MSRDVLSELLNDVRIATSEMGRFSLGAPFNLRVDHASATGFVVLSGGLYWRRSGGPGRWLGPGDAVVGLRDTCSELASDFGVPQRALLDAWRAVGMRLPVAPAPIGAPIRFTWGGDGSRCDLLAIAYSFKDALHPPLFQSLPDDLVIRTADERQRAVVEGALAFLNAEGKTGGAGYAAMAARLAETVLLCLLRSYALQGTGMEMGGLRALRDARLHAALSALHAAPERAWTVQALADIATMSRSVFAQRFAACAGMSPMAYLTEVRMHQARRRLEKERVPVAVLAEQLGYGSDRAFRKAFLRSTGQSPRTWQRCSQPA